MNIIVETENIILWKNLQTFIVTMADVNEKLLMTLLKKAGNSMCADCNSKCEWFKHHFSNKFKTSSSQSFIKLFFFWNDKNVSCLLEQPYFVFTHQPWGGNKFVTEIANNNIFILLRIETINTVQSEFFVYICIVFFYVYAENRVNDTRKLVIGASFREYCNI